MARLLYRLGHFSVRHKGAMIAVWLIALVGIAVGSVAANGETIEGLDIPGTESQEAFDLLDERFPEQAGSSARIAFEAPEGASLLDPEFREPLTDGLRQVVFLPGVVTPVDDTFVTIAPDERIAFANITFAADSADVDAETVETMIAIAEEAAPAVVDVSFGGEVITAAQEAEPPSSEIIGLGVAVLVLLLTFGSVIAMGLPLLTALIGVGIGITGITLTSAFIDLSSVAPTLATMIGLAVGIDYALFVVTRHRQFLHEGYTPAESAARANATAGSAVVFAGMTVVIALAGLAVVGIPFLTVMGLAAAFTVLIAVVIAVTLMPALLGAVGHKIDSLTLPGMKATTGAASDPSTTFSGRFAGTITKRPVAFLMVGLAVLGVIAIPLLSMRLGLSDDGSLPEGKTQKVAYDTLAEGFGPGFNGPLSLVVDISDATDPDATLMTIAEAVAADENVAQVAPPTINAEGDTAIISAIPLTGPSSEDTSSLVHRLRDDVLPPTVADSGAEVFVSGSTAANIDISDKLSSALPLFMALVIGLTVLLLLVVFRSILVPIKAAIAILLSIGSSFGVLVAMFQWGWLKDIIGLDTTGPIISFLPVIMFAILFGLSMDYEVFILSRIKEDYSRTGEAKQSVLTGLTSSARIITAAALIMISVFLAFVLGDEPTIKMFGIGLAAAVLFDATIVRMIIVPAVMVLFGDNAWYLPKWLDKILPNLDVEGDELMRDLEAKGDPGRETGETFVDSEDESRTGEGAEEGPVLVG